jgi:hypothetical protein
LRDSKLKRDYLLFAESRTSKSEDTGNISEVFVTNNEKFPILVHLGTIFRGKTQERAAIHDCIIPPGEGRRIAVRCVHASRGISAKADMTYGGTTPVVVTSSLSGGQSQTWASVNAYSAHYYFAASSSTFPGMNRQHEMSNTTAYYTPLADDMAKTMDGVSDLMKEALGKMPEHKKQVGSVFLKENSVSAIDLFDLPDSWRALRKDIMEKEGLTIAKEDKDQMFKFDGSKSGKIISSFLSGEWKETPIFKEAGFSVFLVENDKLKGEFSTLKDKIIHTTLWKK